VLLAVMLSKPFAGLAGGVFDWVLNIFDESSPASYINGGKTTKKHIFEEDK